MNYVIRRIRDLEPARLEWVIFEPWIQLQLKENNLLKRRLIYYHDLPATLLALRGIHRQARPEEGRLVHYRRILQHFACRATNQGLALSLITDLYPMADAEAAFQRALDRRRAMQVQLTF